MSLSRAKSGRKRGSVSKFLLSPFFTGILLPGALLIAGTIYHFVTVRGKDQEVETLREQLRILGDEKEGLQKRLKILESQPGPLQKK